ncbi:MAG: LOG family protein [Candidatus Rokubacteria bacterium]|nr:LOG family protein [Candidatus Rokubacteria bacterium]MBI3108906.1 LOG family protein [Candidatus Rokubacteria bacterium]
MKLTIGVMGASGGDLTEEIKQRAYRLGETIAERDATLITGGCPGLPYEAVRGAKTKGGLVVGISPGLSIDEHQGKYRSPVEGFDVLIFTGSGLMGREITNIRSSDIVVIAGGRTGTLGELAIAYDEGRLIGVLTGTGGITGIVEEILRVSGKETGACVIYDDDPVKLVDRLIHYYHTQHFRKPSCFCDARAEG